MLQCSNTDADFLFSDAITMNNSKNNDESNGDDYDNVADNNNMPYCSRLICIQEVLGSNLGRDTGYTELEYDFRDFPQPLQAVTACFHIHSNSLFTNHPIIWSYIVHIVMAL